MPQTATRAVTGEDYYLENYGDYHRQNPHHKLEYYVRWIERHRAPERNPRLHDVGCGLGSFLANVPADWEVCGSDVNSFAVEEAGRVVPRGEFAQGSGALENLFRKPFDVVSAFDVLEHVPDLERTGETLKAQLVPGGLFLFVVPVYDGLSGPVISALDKDPTHVHKVPRKFWLDWARQYFTVLDWEGIVRYLLPGGYYLNLPTRLGRAHTPAIIVACRKR